METTKSIIDSLQNSKYFTKRKKKEKKNLIALQNKDLALSQKARQGFGLLWPKKQLNKHFICNKKHIISHALYNDSPATSYFTKLQIQHPIG